MLFDSRIAQEIVQKINDNSEAGQSKCPFIDSDGGLSLVARNWTKLCPSRPVTVFQRDKAFSPLTEKLLENHPEICLKEYNLVKEFTNALIAEVEQSEGENLPDVTTTSLALETAEYKNGWNNPVPGFTLFGTVSHTVCKGNINFFNNIYFFFVQK